MHPGPYGSSEGSSSQRLDARHLRDVRRAAVPFSEQVDAVHCCVLPRAVVPSLLCNVFCTMSSPRRGGLREPTRLNALLLPKFDGWAIILPLAAPSVRRAHPRPSPPVPESMTIPQISSIVI